MTKWAYKTLFSIFFSIFGMLFTLTPCYAGGGRERKLAQADMLINERQFDEAMGLLSDIARRNPEDFDLVHNRFLRIYGIQEDFNRLVDDLIDTVLNNPEDLEKIVSLSRQILEMDDNKNPLLISFVSRTREIAQFNIDRNRLQQILVRGRELLDRGDSEAALGVYSGGMDIMRDRFFAAGFGSAIEGEVRRETERVNTVITAFRATGAAMGTIAAELTSAVNAGEFERTGLIISRLEPAIGRFIQLKNELHITISAFDRILAELWRLDPEMGDHNHLSFFSRLINGRSGETIQEGMLGVFDNYWENSIGRVFSAIIQYAETQNTQAVAAFNAANYSAVTVLLTRTGQFIGLSPGLFRRKLLLNERDRQYADGRRIVSMFGNQIHSDDLRSFIKLRSLSEAGNYLIQAAAIAGRMAPVVNVQQTSLVQFREGSINASSAINIEQQARNILNSVKTDLDETITAARQTDLEINRHYETIHVKNAIDTMERFNLFVLNHQLQSANRFYTIANQELSVSLASGKNELERGINFLEGNRPDRGDGTFALELFPSEAFAVFNVMLAQITADIQRGNTYLTSFTNESSFVISNSEILSMQAAVRNTVNELNDVHTRGLALSETARSRSTRAEAFRQEGDRLLREAETAFQRQNYEAARTGLQRASERFVNSLEIQESASLRESWDDRVINLGRQIAAAENEVIIAEVRNLVNNARNSYFNGNFQQAEESLNRARNRWRVTNTEENEEVLYWLGMVRGAMSARQGRVIPPTAPLFPEMSQLLSEASRNFEEGVLLINAGNRSGGLTRFAEARQHTREVRLMFPLNQEAGMLDLRIEQFTDPAAFNAVFDQRLRTAVSGTQQRSMQAFADLQNLAEINPNYSGMRGIVIQAEIDMGFRPPPPDPQDIARSSELTASASRIVETNNRAMFDVALAQINQAISLNPENLEATRVKDRLHMRMNVPDGNVLSSQDENEYQRALRELQAGNTLVAHAVVQRLMQNPANRNVPKLVDLQRRIQSIL